MTKLLDQKRSQAIGIVIGRIDVREFRDALINFDAAAFPLDTLKSVYDVVRSFEGLRVYLYSYSVHTHLLIFALFAKY